MAIFIDFQSCKKDFNKSNDVKPNYGKTPFDSMGVHIKEMKSMQECLITLEDDMIYLLQIIEKINQVTKDIEKDALYLQLSMNGLKG